MLTTYPLHPATRVLRRYHPQRLTRSIRLERPRYVDDVPAAVELARRLGWQAAHLASDWWGLESPTGSLRTASYGSWLVFSGPESASVEVLTHEEYQARYGAHSAS